MKEELKQKAIELRKQGISIIKIGKELGVAKSSVSVWTRGITLTDEQKYNLLFRENINERALAISATSRIRRQQYQDRGKERIKNGDPLYVAGCMLYWGEGTKGKNTASIANAEPAMLILFKKFLMQFFDLANEDMTISINCYIDLHSFEEIKNYWLSILDLPESCLRKSQINNRPRSSKNKMNHSEYGTCYLTVCSTEIVQEIYGAIQEFSQFTKPNWLG